MAGTRPAMERVLDRDHWRAYNLPMKNTPTDPVPIRQSLTYLEDLLSTHGFVCQRLIFKQEGTPDVENLFARLGSGAPHFCFAGHTDVVPEGLADKWTHPPFAGVDPGMLSGVVR